MSLIPRNSFKGCGDLAPLAGKSIRLSHDEIEGLFREFATESARFSKQVFSNEVPDEGEKPEMAESNLEISKTVFGKWCIEIMAMLDEQESIRFEQLRRDLGSVSPKFSPRSCCGWKSRAL